MLNRMKERGWIKEYANKEHKHSKRIELGAKGEQVSKYCITGNEKNAILIMSGFTADDKDLCIQLLKNIEI